MKPKRILLVRHGESEGNIDHDVYGKKPDYTLTLTPRGVTQAQEAGKKLRDIVGTETIKFYVSPFWRTRETFENIAMHLERKQFVFAEEPRIREQEWGHLRDRKAGEEVMKARDAYGTFYYRIPDGESCADVYDRLSGFFDTLHRDFEKPSFPQNVVIVTHGMAIRLFLMKWFHWTVEEFEKIANPKNCEIIELQLQESGKYKLLTDLNTHEVFHKFQRPLKTI